MFFVGIFVESIFMLLIVCGWFLFICCSVPFSKYACLNMGIFVVLIVCGWFLFICCSMSFSKYDCLCRVWCCVYYSFLR